MGAIRYGFAAAAASGVTLLASTLSANPVLYPTVSGFGETAIVFVRHGHGGGHHGIRGHHRGEGRLRWYIRRHSIRLRSAPDDLPGRQELPFEQPQDEEALTKSAPPVQTGRSDEPGRPAMPPPNRTDCDAAGEIVASYAFSQVQPIRCRGRVFEFHAMRGNKAYRVALEAETGEIVKVSRLDDSTF